MKIDAPQNFIYTHSTNDVMQPNQHIFDIYSTDKTKKLGMLVCHKSEIPLRSDYEGSVLAIDYLIVNKMNNGVGTQILKFAKDYSEQIGCNGYMTLKSDVSFTPARIPHLFYRRFGFSSFDKKTDKKLDKFIKTNRDATYKDFPCLIMHYPKPAEKPSKIREIIFKVFKKIFK